MVNFTHLRILLIMYMPPINPTPFSYLRATWNPTLGHVRGGNRCGGYTSLRVTTTNAG